MQDLSERLHAALLPVLHYQPAAPLVQLCSHFREACHDVGPISAAVRRLRWCSMEHPSAGPAIQAAHQQLSGRDGCVPPASYLALMAALTQGLPPGLEQDLVQLFQQLAALSPAFPTFRHSVVVVLLVEALAGGGSRTGRVSRRSLLEAELRGSLGALLQEAAWLQKVRYPEPAVEWGQHTQPLAAAGAHSACAAAAARQAQSIMWLLPA